MTAPFFFFWVNKYFITQPKTEEIQKKLDLELSLSKAFITDKSSMNALFFEVTS